MSVTPLPRPRSGANDQPHTVGADLSGVRGWFADRAHDMKMAPTYGWPLMATWIKAAIVIGGGLAALLTLRWIGATVIGLAHALPWPTPTDRDHTGLLATIDQPVRDYLTEHTRALPVTATTAYSTWQAVGAVSLLLGFFHSSGARLTWIIWGAATVGMVWTTSPDSGRAVAAGIALLAWAALSLFALRGLSFSPAAFIQVDVHNQAPPAPEVEVRAEIHMPKPEPTTYKPYDPQQPPSLN
ncbi:hypothetical protein ACFYPB_40555 [Streptomyces olivaceoviridis]|uniref:hypothetical protein n=1 Tax=Streptomyces olivaceoviridis TaxID=1921 RepID=UPI0036B00FCB